MLGHSYGGVSALEATFLTNRISKLILYEPPVQDPESSLPNPTQVVLKGQQHNAMDSARDVLANAIVDFLLGRPD